MVPERAVEALENMPDVIELFDRHGRYTYVNPSAERIFHQTRDHLLGRSFADVPSRRTAAFQSAYELALERHVPVQFQQLVGIVWFDVSMYPSDHGVAVCSRDITAHKQVEEALRTSEERFRRYFELGLIGMAITSPTETILEVNDEICRILGYSRDELLATTWTALTYPEDLDADLASFKRVLSGEIDGYALDKRWIRKDGRVLDSTISVKCVRRPDGSVDQFMALLQDVTQRKRTDRALRDAQEELEQRVESRTHELAAANEQLTAEMVRREEVERTLRRSQLSLSEAQRLTHIGSFAWNAESGDTSWSHETYRLSGLEPGSASPSYETFRALIHPDDRDRLADTFLRVVRDLGEYELGFKIVRADGETRHIRSIGHAILDEAGHLTDVVGTVLDVTQSHQAEDERRRLLGRVMTAHEEERGRISREMHDELGQHLSVVALKIAALKRRYADLPDARAEIEDIEATMQRLDANVDLLVWNLRPTALDDLGLLVALSTFVTTWGQHFGVDVELHSGGMEKERLGPETERTLYRVLQEALTNVAKHASAKSVAVLLERRANQVLLIIEDDGKGFDLAKADPRGSGGLGLVGIQERVALVGGTFAIESRRGHGTTIIVRVPA